MKKLVGPKEAAAYLQLSLNTIYQWVSQKRIPYYKVSRLVRFDLNEIDNWLKDKKQDIYEYDRRR